MTIAVSGGEIGLIAILVAAILAALAGSVAAGTAGRGRLPGRPEDDGRRDHAAVRTRFGRRDRATPVLTAAALTLLTALTAVLLVWGDGLDVWAYVLMAAALGLVWSTTVLTIRRSRAAPEA